MSRKLDKEAVAQLLCEALFTNDETVCRTYGIADRTLRNYRRRLLSDTELAGFFRNKRKALEGRWGEECLPALTTALHFLNNAVRNASQQQMKNPAFITSVTNAFRAVAEVRLTIEMLDVMTAQNAANDDDSLPVADLETNQQEYLH